MIQAVDQRGDQVGRLLGQVAVILLPGAGPITAQVPAAQHQHLVDRATRERMLGPLLLAVDAGELQLPAAVVDSLVDRQREALLWCMELELRLFEVRDWFGEAGGVEHVVLKGPATAHLDDDDASLRTFADLDLLVSSEDLDRAVEVLAGRGAVRPWVQRRPGYDHRFAKSVTMTLPGGVEIDLHRSLCDGVHGFRIPLDRLFGEHESFDLAGETIGVLSRRHRFLHAAYHAVLGSRWPRLMSQRDIGGYLVQPDLQPDTVVPEVQRWRGEEVLATAVREVLNLLPFDAPEWRAWVDDRTPEPDEVATIARQRVEGSSLGPAKLEAVHELTSRRDQFAYLAALAWPSGDHLRSRSLRRRDLLRGQLEAARTLGAGRVSRRGP